MMRDERLKYNITTEVFKQVEKFKLGWFSTGRDHAARDLLDVVLRDIQRGVIPRCEVSYVFCSREEGEDQESDNFIKQVRGKNIPLVWYSSQKFKPEQRKRGLELEKLGDSRTIEEWRRDYDREVKERIKDFSVDLVVLAGYMLVVGEEMCQEYPMINLHPAGPGGPKGAWEEVIWELMMNRSEETGVMMHLVTPELDEGPPVTYCLFSINEPSMEPLWKELEEKEQQQPDFLKNGGVKAAQELSLFHKIREKGLIREFPLISATVKVFAEGKVRIDGQRILDSRGRELTEGYDLTEIMEQTIHLD